MIIDSTQNKPCVGLILTGGGARAAYQVGVLKAICEIVPRHAATPFPVISGTSAGAINGAVLAIYADQFTLGVRRLVRVWRNFHSEQVFRTDALGVIKSGLHWLTAMAFGGLGRYNPYALLDREPLAELIVRAVPCQHIQRCIDSGHLQGISVSVSGYASGRSMTFFQSKPGIKGWSRARRFGVPSMITQDHLLASSAIPFLFPAVKLGREYFGDGSMRQIAPISPALHMGAERVMVIGVRREKEEQLERSAYLDYPSFGQVAGYVLDSIFLDSLSTDLERLQRINKTISVIPSHHLEEGGVSLKPVEVLVISPSEDIHKIASRHMGDLPLSVRMLLRGIGAINKGGSNLVSYLLFEKGYCRELIDLGYRDTVGRKDEVVKFLGIESEE